MPPPPDPDRRPLARDVSGPPQAPTALLLHDLPDDRRAWRALVADMDEEFRTIAPDLRGFGESARPPDDDDNDDSDAAPAPAMADYAADLIALLDDEGVDRCAVIGAGFGGEVALELALAAPARVELLVLSGVVPAADHPSWTEELRACERERAELERLAERFGMGRAAARAAEALADPTLRASLRARYRALDAEAFAAAQRARSARADLLPRLAALAAPALVVAGADDPLAPAARLLAETLPHGRLVVLEGCGRGAPFVAPRAFEGALGAFLGDLRGGMAAPAAGA